MNLGKVATMLGIWLVIAGFFFVFAQILGAQFQNHDLRLIVIFSISAIGGVLGSLAALSFLEYQD
jgi:hypothetical protein